MRWLMLLDRSISSESMEIFFGVLKTEEVVEKVLSEGLIV